MSFLIHAPVLPAPLNQLPERKIEAVDAAVSATTITDIFDCYSKFHSPMMLRTKELDATLFEACEDGRVVDAVEALDLGADVNIRKRVTTMVIVSEGGETNPKAETREAESALCVAVRGGHVEAVRILLERGADPEAPIEWSTPRPRVIPPNFPPTTTSSPTPALASESSDSPLSSSPPYAFWSTPNHFPSALHLSLTSGARRFNKKGAAISVGGTQSLTSAPKTPHVLVHLKPNPAIVTLLAPYFSRIPHEVVDLAKSLAVSQAGTWTAIAAALERRSTSEACHHRNGCDAAVTHGGSSSSCACSCPCSLSASTLRDSPDTGTPTPPAMPAPVPTPTRAAQHLGGIAQAAEPPTLVLSPIPAPSPAVVAATKAMLAASEAPPCTSEKEVHEVVVSVVDPGESLREDVTVKPPPPPGVITRSGTPKRGKVGVPPAPSSTSTTTSNTSQPLLFSKHSPGPTFTQSRPHRSASAAGLPNRPALPAPGAKPATSVVSSQAKHSRTTSGRGSVLARSATSAPGQMSPDSVLGSRSGTPSSPNLASLHTGPQHGQGQTRRRGASSAALSSAAAVTRPPYTIQGHRRAAASVHIRSSSGVASSTVAGGSLAAREHPPLVVSDAVPSSRRPARIATATPPAVMGSVALPFGAAKPATMPTASASVPTAMAAPPVHFSPPTPPATTVSSTSSSRAEAAPPMDLTIPSDMHPVLAHLTSALRNHSRALADHARLAAEQARTIAEQARIIEEMGWRWERASGAFLGAGGGAAQMLAHQRQHAVDVRNSEGQTRRGWSMLAEAGYPPYLPSARLSPPWNENTHYHKATPNFNLTSSGSVQAPHQSAAYPTPPPPLTMPPFASRENPRGHRASAPVGTPLSAPAPPTYPVPVPPPVPAPARYPLFVGEAAPNWSLGGEMEMEDLDSEGSVYETDEEGDGEGGRIVGLSKERVFGGSAVSETDW
ncbi:hypothetical protein HDU93_010095 [Gonapodya sp. JEL0774]|nr:hypothetical protein HDU93_010095 [Gonapodya sp. JEL0774]